MKRCLWDNDTVDIIMSNCVINLSPQKAAVFAEAFRVLKPGGRLAISDIVTDRHFTAEQQADSASWSACVSGAIPAAEYTALIEQAGFTDVQVVDKASAEAILPQRNGIATNIQRSDYCTETCVSPLFAINLRRRVI